MKRRQRQILTTAAIGFGLCLLAVACIPVYLNTDHAQAIAKRLINQHISGELEWAGLHLSVIRANAEFQRLQINGVNEVAVAGFERLNIRWSWRDLFKGELTLGGQLEKPWVHLKQDQNGRLNLIDAFIKTEPASSQDKTTGGFPININISSFEMRDGLFRFQKRDIPLWVELDGIDLDFAGNLGKAVADAEVRFTGGRFSLKDATTHLKPSAFVARYAHNRIDPVQIELATEAAHANITGSIEAPLGKRMLNLKGDLTASLEDTAHLLGWPAALTGTTTLAISIRGTPDNPDIDLKLAYGGGTIFDRQIENLDLEVSVADRLLRIDNLGLTAGTGKLHLKGNADLQTVFPSGFFDSHPDFEALTYQLRVEQNELALETLLGKAAGLAGEVDALIEISGTGIHPETLKADGSIEAQGSGLTTSHKVAPVTLSLQSQLALDHGRVSLHRLSAQAGDLNIEARGQADISTHGVSADFHLKAPHLSETLTPLGMDALKGQAEMKGKIAGSFRQPEFKFFFDGSGLAYKDIRIGDILLDASLDAKGIFHLAELTLENQGSVLKGKGELQILNSARQFQPDPPLGLELTLSDIEALDFVGAELARGRLGGKVKLKGTLRAPKGQLNLEGREIGFEDISVGDINASLEYRDGSLIMEKVEVINGDTFLTLTGTTQVIDPKTLELTQDPAMDVEVIGKNITLENYLTEYKGRLSLDARLKGHLKEPHGPVRIHGEGFESPWQNLDQLNLNAHLDGDSLRVDRLALSPALDEWVHLSGRVSLKSLSDVNIATDGISVVHFDWLKENLPVTGKLKCRLTGEGSFDNLTASGNLILTEFAVAGKPVEDIHGAVELADHELRFDVRHSALDIGGAYHLLNKTISGNARVHVDDLNPYLALFGLNDFGGRVRGAFKIDGKLDHPEQSAISGNIESVRIDFKGQEMLRTRNAQLIFADGQFRIPGWDLQLLEKGSLRVKGTGRPGETIDLAAEGKMPLALAQMLPMDLQDLSGDLVLSATAKGEWDQPDLRGNVRLKSAALTLPGSHQRLYGVNGAITLDPNRISITSLNGKLDKGSFNLFGNLALDRFQPEQVDMTLRTTSLPITVPGMLDVFLDSRLELSGTPDEANLSGNVVMFDGVYYKDITLNPLEMLRPREERAVKPRPPDITLPYLNNLRLNVMISGRNPFMVDNNLAELEVIPDIHIMGTLQQPRVIGRTDIPDGIIRFQARRFQVTGGTIDFVNPFEIQPEVNIRGETEIRQWTVYVDVTGPVGDLELKLSSDPAEEPGDILALILTGRTSHELSTGQGRGGNATAEILAAFASSSLGEEVAGLMGWDTIEVDKVADSDADRDNTRVTIGKNLSERMTLRYGVEAKEGELVRKTIADFQLLERVLLSGFQDSRGIYGGALVFRIEFR
jgi:autotransporter translocation and assembly factor TamB